MESPRRKGDKRERTRAALIEMTLQVVGEKGFAGVSLDEIAARAGMTKGAIYGNFGDKADLLLAAMEKSGFNLAPKYVPGATLKQQMRAIAESLLDVLPKVRSVEKLNAEFQLYALVEPELRRRLAEPYARFFALMTDQLNASYGAELTIPARSLVVSIQALALGFAHQWSLTPEEVTPDVVIAAFEGLADGAVHRSSAVKTELAAATTR